MADPAVGIRDLLITAGVGTFAGRTGWSIYVNEQPANPDTCITIRNTGGLSSNPKWLLDFPNVQVLVRGSESGYQNAWAKCVEIKNALLGLPSQDHNGDRWVAINAIGDITSVGVDENRRPLFTLNFSLIIEPASGGYRDPL